MGSAYAQTGAPVSVSAAKPGKKGAKQTLHRVSIEVVENGYIGRCSYDAPASKDGFPRYQPDKEYALADRKAVDKFLDEMLGLGAKTEPKKG